MKFSAFVVSSLSLASWSVVQGREDRKLRRGKNNRSSGATKTHHHRILAHGSNGLPSVAVGNLGNIGTKPAIKNLKQDHTTSDDDLKVKCAAAMKTLAEEKLGVLHEDAPDFAGEGDAYVDKSGNAHLHLVNMVDGEPVAGSKVVMHIASDGTIKAVNGEIVKKPSTTEGPMLDAMDALKTALIQQGLKGGTFVDTPKLKWVRDPRTGELCRAWMASYRYDTPDGNFKIPHRDEIYVNAWTGEVRKKEHVCVKCLKEAENSFLHSSLLQQHFRLAPSSHAFMAPSPAC